MKKRTLHSLYLGFVSSAILSICPVEGSFLDGISELEIPTEVPAEENVPEQAQTVPEPSPPQNDKVNKPLTKKKKPIPNYILVKAEESNGVVQAMIFDTSKNQLIDNSVYSLKGVRVGQVVDTPVGPVTYVGGRGDVPPGALRKDIIRGLKFHLYGGVERADNDPAAVTLTFNHFKADGNWALLGISKAESKSPMKHELKGTWMLMKRTGSSWQLATAFQNQAELQKSSKIFKKNKVPAILMPQ